MGDAEKTQCAATISHDCTISGGEKRAKKQMSNSQVEGSHSEPSKERLPHTRRRVAGAIKPLAATHILL